MGKLNPSKSNEEMSMKDASNYWSGFVAGSITRGFTAHYCYPPRRLCGHLAQCL